METGGCGSDTQRWPYVEEMLSFQGNRAVSGSELEEILLTRQGFFFLVALGKGKLIQYVGAQG